MEPLILSPSALGLGREEEPRGAGRSGTIEAGAHAGVEGTWIVIREVVGSDRIWG